MIYRIFKKIVSPAFTFASFLVFGGVAFAFDCSAVPVLDCSQTNLDTPLPADMLCPVLRVFNLALYALGAIFLILIVYGAIKLALAMGDPKGYQGAQQVFTYAVLGGFVVLAFFAALLITSNIIGISPFSGPNAIVSQIQCGLWRFIDAAGITNDVTP